MSEVAHRFVETNGIRVHVAEQGSGPLVLLLHGFPESWYSWCSPPSTGTAITPRPARSHVTAVRRGGTPVSSTVGVRCLMA